MTIYVADFFLLFLFFVCKKPQFCKKFLQNIKSKKYGSHNGDHTTLNTSACLVWNSLSNNYKDDTMTATFKLSCKFFVEKSAATDCSQCTHLCRVRFL